MKLERLRILLELRSTVKLCVLTDRFCLCGLVGHARAGADGLQVRIAESVRVILPTMELIEEPDNSGTLVLTDRHKLTRRLQTHGRHLEGMNIPAEYFELARQL